MMMRSGAKLTKSAMLAAALGLVGAALAAPAYAAGGGKAFDRTDANGDGAITRDELETARAARIASIDADGDGVVSADEWRGAVERRASRRAEARFARLDSNGDGALDAAEQAAFGDRMDTWFEKRDANKDGRVTREEARRAR